MGTISQMAKAIVTYPKGLVKSGHDETSLNISLTPVFQNEPASATCEAGHCAYSVRLTFK